MIVGTDRVSTDATTLEKYSRDQSFVRPCTPDYKVSQVFVTGRMEYSAERFKELSKNPAPLLKMILDTREQVGMSKLELNAEGNGWKPAE